MKQTYKVDRISMTMARPYIIANHYSKSMPPANVAYGLFDGAYDNLIGVCAFGPGVGPAILEKPLGKEYKENVIELIRLHILDVTPKNTESWFVSRAMRMLKDDYPELLVVVSYSDPYQGHRGTIYAASNFIYTGEGGGSTVLVDPQGNEQHSRINVARRNNAKELRELGYTTKQIETKKRWMYVIANNKKQAKFIKRHIRQACQKDCWDSIDEKIIKIGFNERYEQATIF